MTNKTNKIKKKRGLSKVTSFTIHHVYSYREVPLFSLNLLKRTLWLFFLNPVTSGLASQNIVLNISRCVSLAVVFDFSSSLDKV